jgi:dihydroorotase
MFIDPHVHLRDFNQKHKETIKHGLEVAYNSGLDAVFDMPNTNPAIITRDVVIDRLKIVKDANVSGVFYGLYIGLTSDTEQVKRAVDIYREFPQVVGMKLYAGHSVGNLGVIQLEDQQRVYQTLSEQGYYGMLAVHAEKESLLEPKLWDPLHPITHCHARPEKAEIASVADQLRLAYESKFHGKLHIAHISSPVAVSMIDSAKIRGLDVSCGVCPHHFIYDWQQMDANDGILWKMNPPLRNLNSKNAMLELLRDGKIDWIETDHAPHSLEEKANEPFMSGIPGIPWWPVFVEHLRRNNFNDNQIEHLTFYNAAKRFGLEISPSKRKLKYRGDDYPFNPYQPMENHIGYKK